MVILRWAIPNPNNTGHFFAVHNSLAGAPVQNSHCNAHNHRAHLAGHATVPPPFSGDMDVVNILLRLRVSNSDSLLDQQSSLRVVLSYLGAE